jgi:hypothetical protein
MIYKDGFNISKIPKMSSQKVKDGLIKVLTLTIEFVYFYC